jgi:beta-phosphoglucomutase
MPTKGSVVAAVLFDFDGVIVNSEPLHFYAMHQVLLDEHVEITEDEYYRELIGFDDRGAFRHVFEKRSRPLDPPTLLRVMARKSRVMMDLIFDRKFHALPGVEELVRGLWRNYPLAICSGGLREEIEAMLEGVALRDCFQVIVAAEDVTAGKPDPQGYLLAMRLLGERVHKSLKPEQCLVVEDAPKVIRNVKTKGFRTLGLATTYGPDMLVDADHVVASLHPSEVLKKIPNLQILQ